MVQFLGNIEAKTDAKGRVFIPAAFRKQLQAVSEERLVLRKDVYQDCLVLYPESAWFATQNLIRNKLNRWDARQQMIFRQFVSDAEVVIPDSNGRILIPKRYLQMAGIQSDVRFIGMDNTMEIWAKPSKNCLEVQTAARKRKKRQQRINQPPDLYRGDKEDRR